jgi:hypothetical protein
MQIGDYKLTAINSGYFKLVTLSENKYLLQEAIERKWMLFLEHDPDTVMVTVTKTDKGFTAGKKYNEL